MKIYAIKLTQLKSLLAKNLKKSYVNIHLTNSKGLVMLIDKGTTNVHKPGSDKSKANKLMRQPVLFSDWESGGLRWRQ